MFDEAPIEDSANDGSSNIEFVSPSGGSGGSGGIFDRITRFAKGTGVFDKSPKTLRLEFDWTLFETSGKR